MRASALGQDHSHAPQSGSRQGSKTALAEKIRPAEAHPPAAGSAHNRETDPESGEQTPARRFWQVMLGILLVMVGLPGLVLPVIPGVPFIAGGMVLILGTRHRWVQQSRQWLVEKGVLKPKADSSDTAG